MVGFGDYGVGIGMIAIIAAVAAGFWYVASDEYFQPESSADDTNIQTNDMQTESVTDVTGEQTDVNSDELSNSVSPGSSTSPDDNPGTIDQNQLPWTTMVSAMISEYNSLKAFREEQSTHVSSLDGSANLDSSPMLATASQVLIEETPPREELREADFDNGDDDTDSPDTDLFLGRNEPQATAEEPAEPEIDNEAVAEDDRTENEDIEPVVDVLDELVDDLEETDEVVSDLLHTTDEVLQVDEERDESDNSGPGSQNSGKGGAEQDDSDNSGEDDDEDRSGSNSGPG